MDVALCCVLAAIGFDLAENLVYSITATMAVTVVRALESVAGHTLYGAIMGFMLARAERAEKRGGDATAWHVAAVAVPTALHGLPKRSAFFQSEVTCRFLEHTLAQHILRHSHT